MRAVATKGLCLVAGAQQVGGTLGRVARRDLDAGGDARRRCRYWHGARLGLARDLDALLRIIFRL